MKFQNLRVYSANIDSQLKFYKKLGFEIRNASEDAFEIVCGYSVLQFIAREHSQPYHIAFHIPDRQEEEALQWLEKLVPVLGFNDDKIIDFENWQAKSLYFYDEDKNIMEFISRRDFKKPDSGIFEAKSIVGIAEVGMATTNIRRQFEKLQAVAGLEKFDGDLERFCATGDPSGLFIVINKDKKDWFPVGDTAYSADFEVEFSHDSINYSATFKEGELQLKSI
ncbi:VOC family protein [Christiangramia aquimixticola]|uniref:VOC family protein n=1 Tax=Christiangramia aquimixticola TaxID=1697558 RepID=UPI003AA90DFA